MITIQIEKIKESAAFIAYITERFIEQKEKKYRECKMAEELNKPMYAVVDQEVARELVVVTDASSGLLEVRKIAVDWPPFEDLPWRKICYCEDGSESIAKDIEDDLVWFRSIRQ